MTNGHNETDSRDILTDSYLNYFHLHDYKLCAWFWDALLFKTTTVYMKLQEWYSKSDNMPDCTGVCH
jgi:hypothetical protein